MDHRVTHEVGEHLPDPRRVGVNRGNIFLDFQGQGVAPVRSFLQVRLDQNPGDLSEVDPLQVEPEFTEAVAGQFEDVIDQLGQMKGGLGNHLDRFDLGGLRVVSIHLDDFGEPQQSGQRRPELMRGRHGERRASLVHLL